MDTSELDKRRNAYRADLAAELLRGKVAAPRYAAGEARRVVDGAVPLRGTPDTHASWTTEVLFGEHVTVYDEHEGWAWVQLAGDGYVGYLPASALASGAADPDAPGGGARHVSLSGGRLQVPASAGAQHQCGALRGGDRACVRQARGRPFRAHAAHRRARPLHARLRRGRRSLPRRALRVGRQDPARGGLLRAAAGRHAGRRPGLPTRQRHAAGGAGHRGRGERRAAAASRAAISCSGPATSASCSMPSASCTPTPTTWPSRPSRCGWRRTVSRGAARSSPPSSGWRLAQLLSNPSYRSRQIGSYRIVMPVSTGIHASSLRGSPTSRG